ncbi:hypothetical protein FNO01nite_28090 [Flavobacterium noncentrifugens]|uniref:HEPN domain-containing protein n=1 Tax=Flavobacterium noncentrifugens TaxID=1128970 RepID=A0A1G9CT36_9FLAO|nr:hypothetical protein [Flavobacterium noncentrifugens]GEP52137.1 hypothetical protein FNO01nite_28090 [Flavobacterium noncentrifugens]SDK54615.1 hypothetical protein SAMN04487935_3637 [Flavobacterium noncentrifugens]
MDHYVLKPRNHPQSHLLMLITNELLDFINADSVYYSLDNTGGGPKIIFSIFMHRDSMQIEGDLFAVADRVFKPYPEIAYQILSCDYAEDALRKGNLFLLRHCTLGELAYANPSADHAFYPEEATVSKLVRRAAKHFKKHMNKVDVCLLDVPRSIEYQNDLEAAFTIHKAMQLLYKTATHFIMGKPYAAKSIAAQQLHLSKFAPSLSNLFQIGQEEESDLLEKLDECYWSYKRKQVHNVKLPDLGKVQEKVARLKDEVQKMFDQMVAECTEKISYREDIVEAGDTAPLLATPTGNFEASANDLEAVCQIIRDFIPTDAVYCFGKKEVEHTEKLAIGHSKGNFQQTRLYLLVLTTSTRANASADLGSIISSKTDQRFVAVLLVHKTDSLKKAAGDQLCFFSSVIANGELLYGKEGFRCPLHSKDAGVRNLSFAEIFMGERKTIGNCFLDAHFERLSRNVSTIDQVMLNLAVEHTCLGLIRVFLGYTPNYFSLGFFIDLCGFFTSLPNQFFPRASEEDKRLFKMISTHPSSMRFHYEWEVNYTDMDFLSGRCGELMKLASELTDKELARLKSEGMQTVNDNKLQNNPS